MRPQPFPASILAFAAFVSAAALASCAGPPRAVVALDEAFSAARPGLAARLEAPSLFGIGPWGLLEPPRVVRVTLAEGAGKALDAAIAETKRSGRRTALVASPLIAKAIVAGGTWSGDPPILVPEWHSLALPVAGVQATRPAPGLWPVSTDPVPAYRAAGAACGAFLAAIVKEGGAPSCGLLFCEAPARPRAALTAFAAAFAEASEGAPLYVREIADQAQAADAAAKELLGSDIRVLFVAVGSATGAAIRAAERPGVVIGADSLAPELPAALAFSIAPDDAGLARAIDRARRALAAGPTGDKTPPASSFAAIPALLVPGPAAGSIKAGRLDFGVFLGRASKGRE